MSGGELDLDALAALLDAATPRPWLADEIDDLWHEEADGHPVLVAGRVEPEDAELIAALRNAAPALIAAARERDTAVGQAQTLLKSARLSADQAQRHRVERDAARAEVAALRERVETVLDQHLCSCDFSTGPEVAHDCPAHRNLAGLVVNKVRAALTAGGDQ